MAYRDNQYPTSGEYLYQRRRVSYTPAIASGEPYANRQAYRSPARMPVWYQGDATNAIPAVEYRPQAYREQPRVTYRYMAYHEPQIQTRAPTTTYAREVQDDIANITPRYVTERYSRPEHTLPVEVPIPVRIANCGHGTPYESPPITYWEQPADARRTDNTGNVSRDEQFRRASEYPTVSQQDTPTPQVRLPPRITSAPEYVPSRPQTRPLVAPHNILRDSTNGPSRPPNDDSQVPTVPAFTLPPSGFVNHERQPMKGGRIITTADASTSVMKAPEFRKPTRVDNVAQTSVIRDPLHVPVQVQMVDEESSQPSSSQTTLAGGGASEDEGRRVEASQKACFGLCCC